MSRITYRKLDEFSTKALTVANKLLELRELSNGFVYNGQRIDTFITEEEENIISEKVKDIMSCLADAEDLDMLF